MDIALRGEVQPSMRDVTRDGLDTLLGKVGALRAYSRQRIDFLREKRGLSELVRRDGRWRILGVETS